MVPAPYSDPSAVDPEEAFVASLASCHILWFLSIAAEAGYCVDYYAGAATGIMSCNAEGKMAITSVTPKPLVQCSGALQPKEDKLTAMDHRAHEACFIAISVRTAVNCEPRFTPE